MEHFKFDYCDFSYHKSTGVTNSINNGFVAIHSVTVSHQDPESEETKKNPDVIHSFYCLHLCLPCCDMSKRLLSSEKDLLSWFYFNGH